MSPSSVPTLISGLPSDPTPDTLYDAFEAWTAEQGLTLYPSQTEALIEIVDDANVILATPTGSGKSLVAAGAHFAALAHGRRSYYTAPIKALVSEKFFALCEMFGADNVGMLTGDAAVNPRAPIITATAEVLANHALREGSAADVGLVAVALLAVVLRAAVFLGVAVLRGVVLPAVVLRAVDALPAGGVDVTADTASTARPASTPAAECFVFHAASASASLASSLVAAR